MSTGARTPNALPAMTRADTPASFTTGSEAASKCWNEGAISSSSRGSAIQLWMPSMPCPLARCMAGVRSECAMPRPAVIRFIAPGSIS